MYTLHNGTLECDEENILSQLRSGISLAHFSPAGAFLKVHAEAPASRAVIPIGFPAGQKFAVAHRYEPFWMRPAIVHSVPEIPVETQLLFAQISDGRTLLFVPLVDAHTRCSLQGAATGHLAVVIETGAPEVTAQESIALFVALQPRGEDLHAFLARAAAAVAAHLQIKLRHEKTLPAFADTFGWCTWDAFYQEVSPENIRAGLHSFRDAGIPIGWLIIDDGWQSEHNLGPRQGRRLTALVPNEKFSADLAPTIRMAKAEFGVRHVLVWHTLQGYWAGVDVQAFAAYGAHEVSRNFSPGILHHFPTANSQYWGDSAGILPPQQVDRFFDDYHALLKSQGVDGVKVDNQAATEGLLLSNQSRTAAYRTARQALDDSVQTHFPGNLLHCMSCSNDLLYATGITPLTRTSTDFWPAQPETHGTHLWTNALISLWFAHFVHPDWDMFQSHLDGPWSAFHAAARAISGGPVYVSDKPQLSNAALLQRLAHEDGTVPRCDGPAMPAAECLFADVTRDQVLLKLLNTNRGGTAGVIGLFNCRYDPQNAGLEAAGTISPSDLPAIEGHHRYLAVITRDGATEVPHVMEAREFMRISLRQGGYAVAAIVSVVDGIAVVGLLNKLNIGATVGGMSRDGRTLRMHVRSGGALGLWVEHELEGVEQEGVALSVQTQGHWITTEIARAGEIVVRLK